MTRAEAVDTLRRLSAGLPPDDPGVRRLLERISSSDEPELLRDLLVEAGAHAVLEEVGR